MTSPAKRQQVVEHFQGRFPISERRDCRVMGISRSSQRLHPRDVDRDAPLTHRITELATQYGRYGYRGVMALLRHEGWGVNHKRVERICRREGLKVPQKPPKRGDAGGSLRIRVYDYILSMLGTSGAMTSCSPAHTTGNRFGS